MKYLLFILFFTLSAFSSFIMPEPILSDEERSYLEQKKVINMCIDPDWMPFEKIENGLHVGMSKDYFNMFSRQIGIPIRLI